MSTFTISDTKNLSYPLKLRQLIGPKRADKFAMGHPYHLGFRALRRQMRGDKLSPELMEQFALLHQDAELLFSLETQWSSYRKRLIQSLCSTSACASLRHELRVIRTALRPVTGSIEWLRFQDGTPDIQTRDPDMLVECKLIRTSTDFERIFDVLHRSHGQHPNLRMPYVIAIGFGSEIDVPTAQTLPEVLRQRTDWFLGHPNLAGVIVLVPSPERETDDLLGFRLQAFESGSLTQCLNHTATHPLPPGFTFNPGLNREMPIVLGGSGLRLKA